MQTEPILIYTDGGSRGNPGPAACAFVAEKNGKVIFKSSKFLGNATNNFAEYNGAILALKWLVSQLSNVGCQSQIFFFLDSELVVKQLNGVYKVRDKNLRDLFFEALLLIKKFDGNIIFKHIPREKNKTADFLLNEELDKNF